MQIIQRWTILITLIFVIFLGGCNSSNQASENNNTDNASNATPVAQISPVNPAFKNLPHLTGKATVEILTEKGKVVVEVDGDHAPITAGNFVDLVKRGVYDNTVFHRVIREPQPFVVQGGDPQSKDPNVPKQAFGTGSFIDPDTKKPRYIPLEILPQGEVNIVYSQTFPDAGIKKVPELQHKRGAVAMARSQPPDSASAQFYFALADLSFLDGNYAVFGYVTEGMEVVDKIQQGDRIKSASLIENKQPADDKKETGKKEKGKK
ncbi:MAG TPA: peptidylprolyl isomerase [Allocoleopsis sp.]